MAEAQETELVHAAQSGGLEAFEKLVLRYERPIYGYLSRLVRQREDAEDLTQEVFLKAWRRLGQLGESAKFKAWLYAIATNAAYDQLRRTGYPVVGLDEAETDAETFTSASASPVVEVLANGADLARAREAIRPMYRSVLLLYYQQGFGYAEIAKMLALPMNTVKTHLRRAKAALARELT